MNQHRVPVVPAQPPSPSVVQEAYGQGYLDGHLAGWRDALAVQAVQATQLGPQVQTAQASQGHAQEQVSSPVQRAQVIPASPVPLPATAAAAPVAPPPNVMPAPVQQLPPMHQLPSAMPVDPAVAAARKSKRETQNINITLYVASLLMVAAAALFVGSSQPVAVRLVGVWLATGLFYSAGLMLHGKVARLKPAAVAFTGTALAIIPFAGVATYNLGFPDAPAVWLVTSLIGTVAYVFAAVRLGSRLVVYLSIAFLLSSAWSSVAVLGAALAWYFAALIVFAALISLAGHLFQRHDGEPNLYAKPLTDLGPWFAPVGLAGSLVFSLALNAADHTLVLVAGVIYYAVITAICAPVLRRWNFLGLRLSATLAAPFIGWLLQPEFAWAAGAFTVVLGAQIITISYCKDRIAKFFGHGSWVQRDVFASVPLLAAGSALWSLGLALPWNGILGQSSFVALGLAVGLIISMVVVPVFLPKGEWLPLPVLAFALVCSPILGAADWMALLAIAAVYAVLRHRAARGTIMGHTMLIVARVLATGLVAATLAHFISAQPGKAQLILAVVGVIVALQLLTDALLSKIGAANVITNYAATSWGMIGTAIVLGLCISYSEQSGEAFFGLATSTALRAGFLSAAISMGLATATYSLMTMPRTQGGSRAEFMAPSYLVVAALSTGPVFDAAGASVAWAGGVAYALVAGSLLRQHEEPLHRWIYWWSARGVSLVLVVALFQLWQENDPSTSIDGTHVGVWTVLLIALVPQLLILAVVAARGRIATRLSVDAALTLLAAVGVAMPVVFAAEAGHWTLRVAIVLVSAAVAALAVCGTLRNGAMPSVVWAGPGALALMVLISLNDRPLAAMVLGILTLTSAILAAKAGTIFLRGVHFLLSRVAVTLLVGLVVSELTDNKEIFTLAVTAVLLLQLRLQIMAAAPGRLTAAVGEELLLRASLWLLLTAQLLTPFAYVVQGGGFGATGTALRWVLAVELLALAGSAVVAQARLKQRGASYLVIIAVVGGAVMMAPLLWPGATALILLALCLAAIAWRCTMVPATIEMKWYWVVANASFLATACLVDSDAGTGIFALMWVVEGIAVIVGAHLVKGPELTLPGALMVLLSAFLFRAQVLDLVEHPGMAALTGFVVVVGVLYLARLVFLSLVPAPQVHRLSLIGVALGGGLIFAVWAIFDDATVLLGAGAFTVIAVLACLEAPLAYRRLSVDVAVLSCAVIWYWASTRYIDLGLFWFIQWLALALAALAVIRYRTTSSASGKNMLMVAAAISSFGAVLTIFSGDSLQQVISLLVFVALLVVGMALDERIFTIWGAVGVATAVLWYLRGYTYILLALLALGLIGFVIWRLNRKKPDDAARLVSPLPSVPPVPGTPPAASGQQAQQSPSAPPAPTAPPVSGTAVPPPR